MRRLDAECQALLQVYYVASRKLRGYDTARTSMDASVLATLTRCAQTIAQVLRFVNGSNHVMSHTIAMVSFGCALRQERMTRCLPL